MNSSKQQLLSNFSQHGRTVSHVNLFGQQLNAPAGQVTAVNQMLASFARQGKLRSEASIFGRTAAQIASQRQAAKNTDLVTLINNANLGQLTPA